MIPYERNWQVRFNGLSCDAVDIDSSGEILIWRMIIDGRTFELDLRIVLPVALIERPIT